MACTTDAIGIAADPIQLCARFDACAVTSGDAYAAPSRSERASPAPALVRMIALHDFDPSIALGCVRLVAGQIVTRHALDSSGWCDVEAHGERGWVPASFLMEYTAWQQPPPPYPQPHAAGIKAAARDDPASARSSTVRASPARRMRRSVRSPSLCVRRVRCTTRSRRARRAMRCSARWTWRCTRSSRTRNERVQRVPSRSLAAQRDALMVQLSELLHRIETARAKPEASYADAALGLNSVMLAAAELVDRATAAPPMRRGSGDADSRHACSDGSLSQTPSLLDELSVHDTCSSVRDSAESERSARSAELSDGLERRTSDVLAVSPSQLLDVAHSAYEQVASVAAAFFGQLHTFEDLHLNFAFQRVVDVRRALTASAHYFTALVESVGAYTADAWAAPPLTHEYTAACAELDGAYARFCELISLSAAPQRVVDATSGTERKLYVLSVTNELLCASARALRAVSWMLERAPRTLVLGIPDPTPVLHAAWCAPHTEAPRAPTAEPPRPTTRRVRRRPTCHARRRPTCHVCPAPGTPRAAAPSDAGLVRGAQGEVLGGTLPALAAWLCAEDRGAHTTPVRAFFWCFRAYADPVALADTLLGVYRGAGDDWRVQARVVHHVFAWLKHYWLAADDSAALGTLSDWVAGPHDARVQPRSTRSWRSCGGARVSGTRCSAFELQVACANGVATVQRVVCTAQGERLELGLSGNEGDAAALATCTDARRLCAAPVPGPPAPPVPAVSKGCARRTPRGARFVERITIAEARLFASVLPMELLYCHEPYCRPDGTTATATATHARAMATFTTQLTNWMGECLLRETDVKRRTLVLQHLVRVGSESLALCNFNLLMAVQGALNSSTVLRLKRTWVGLSTKTLARFEAQRAVMEHTRNFAAYRAQLRDAQGPVLPFLGLVNTDVTFCLSGHAKRRAAPEGAPDGTPEVVNWVRCMRLAEIVGEVQRFQARAYTLVEVPEMQRFLAQMRDEVQVASCVQSYAAAAEQLYQRSLQLEPRDEGGAALPRQRSRSRSLVAAALPWNNSLGARRSASERRTSADDTASLDSKRSRWERVRRRR
ncbi:BUD5 [Malassezia furfur]|nr:BUD5 [Malassezia furfur]